MLTLHLNCIEKFSMTPVDMGLIINFLTQAATTSLPRSRHYKQSYGSKELNESSMTNLQAGTIILGTLKYLIMVLFIQRFPRLFPTRDIIELAGLYLLIVIKRCLHVFF
ncbi:hypothetical protein IC575_002292 [Cucumis melo]